LNLSCPEGTTIKVEFESNNIDGTKTCTGTEKIVDGNKDGGNKNGSNKNGGSNNNGSPAPSSGGSSPKSGAVDTQLQAFTFVGAAIAAFFAL
jgi:hypothetical protein